MSETRMDEKATAETDALIAAAADEALEELRHLIVTDAASDDLSGDEEEALDLLREILLDKYTARATEVEAELQALHEVLKALSVRINDKEALVETITPIIASSLRSGIRDSRDEMVEALQPIMAQTIQSSIRDSREPMIEALYPIIGQLIQRAVLEAMRDLQRAIDKQMRNAFSLGGMVQRARARASGVSESELILRNAAPFHVEKIFLIHRETGLLLRYLQFDEDEPREPHEPHDPALGEGDDSDLISSMLTAIRDFTAESFGRDTEGDLDRVQYGDKVILLEEAPLAYLAVVGSGIEPRGFRARMREQIYAVDHEYGPLLGNYSGDATPFVATSPLLTELVAPADVPKPKQNSDASGGIQRTVVVDGLRQRSQRAAIRINRPLLLYALLCAMSIVLLWVWLATSNA